MPEPIDYENLEHRIRTVLEGYRAGTYDCQDSLKYIKGVIEEETGRKIRIKADKK